MKNPWSVKKCGYLLMESYICYPSREVKMIPFSENKFFLVQGKMTIWWII